MHVREAISRAIQLHPTGAKYSRGLLFLSSYRKLRFYTRNTRVTAAEISAKMSAKSMTMTANQTCRIDPFPRLEVTRPRHSPEPRVHGKSHNYYYFVSGGIIAIQRDTDSEPYFRHALRRGWKARSGACSYTAMQWPQS